MKNRNRIYRWVSVLASLVLFTTSCQRAVATIIPTLGPTLPATKISQTVDSQATQALSPTAAQPTLLPSTATPMPSSTSTPTPTLLPTDTPIPTPTATPTHPLMIEVMRQQTYPGSAITFEQLLEPGANYQRHVVSYLSEGNKIYALLTIPSAEMPESGWPIIIFNHGYIPPDEYRTTERYVDYVDRLARSGYIVFRSDYRGHGNSEGEASGSYSSPAYTIDVLNGLASVQSLPEADPSRVGMWGHSMGGHIALRAMVVSEEIDAGVIWAGVVASYPDLFERWRRHADDGPTPTPNPSSTRGRWRQSLFELYGTIEENPGFWASISANSYVKDLSGPLQLHHGTSDNSVPFVFSETLLAEVQAAGKPAELFLYEWDNHNLSGNFGTAMQRSIQFFDLHVKGTE